LVTEYFDSTYFDSNYFETDAGEAPPTPPSAPTGGVGGIKLIQVQRQSILIPVIFTSTERKNVTLPFVELNQLTRPFEIIEVERKATMLPLDIKPLSFKVTSNDRKKFKFIVEADKNFILDLETNKLFELAVQKFKVKNRDEYD